ncbi:MAG TPA: VCBS repeat-containing protein [Alloacidobacterium sp.]|nr:VCBS repeat-containing protein [Alloacidobacterium sp.]
MKKNFAGTLLLFILACAFAAYAQTERKTTPGNGPNGVPQATFFVHRLGTDHAEGVTTLDVNGDGHPDILSGAYWYENPGPQGGEWKQHQYRTVGTHGEFVSDCGEWTVDVNHDGAPDVVTTGWISNGLWWYENPKKPGVMWERHFIADSYDTEGGWMADINGDGKPDLILAHYNHSGILWVDFSGAQPKIHHVGGKEQDGHGTGVADVNGDGKPDILTPTGWLENIDADHDKWQWHPDWDLGDAGFPIIGYDVNNDGKTDIIYGHGHSYGIYWLEQQGDGANRHWVKHTIDESFSQVHALKLVDIDGDGQPELLAGKRYRGHNGNDPGSYDPLVVYYYKIDRKTGQFTRYAISVNGTAGAGTQFVTEDMDGDGDLDIVTAGKTGVHFFENLKVNNIPKEQREREILLNKDWPFPGEGQEVPQENGSKQ